MGNLSWVSHKEARFFFNDNEILSYLTVKKTHLKASHSCEMVAFFFIKPFGRLDVYIERLIFSSLSLFNFVDWSAKQENDKIQKKKK